MQIERSFLAGRASLFLLGLMFCVPFLYYYHYYPIPTFYEETLAFGLGLLAALRLGWSAGRPAQIPQIVLWLLGFAAVLFLQVLIGRVAYFEQSLIGILYVLWAAMLAWLASDLRAELGLAPVCRVLAGALLVGGMLNAVAAIIQLLRIDAFFPSLVSPLTPPWRAFGNLNQINLFADYIALSISSVLYLLQTKRLSRTVAGLVALFLIFVLSLTGSRMVWLFWIALLIWACSCAWREKSGLGRAALCVAVCFSVYALLIFIGHSFGLRFEGQSLDEMASRRALELSIYSDLPGHGQGVRLYLWSHAWRMFLGAPLLGAGFAEFTWNFFQQAEVFAATGIPGIDRNAHNIVLQLLAETGVAGAACVLGGIALWAWRFIRSPMTAEAWWIGSGLIILAVHSLLEFPLWQADFLGVAAVLFGLAELAFFRSSLGPSLRVAGFAIVAFGMFGLIAIVRDYKELEGWLYSRARLSGDNSDIIERQQQALMALQEGSLFSPYVELAYASTVVADRHNLPDKLALIERVMRFSATSMVAFRYVLLLALDGQASAAEASLRRALVLYPSRLPDFSAALELLNARDPVVFGPLRKVILEKLENRLHNN